MTLPDITKLKNRYVTREVDSELVLVPIQSNVASMNELFTMNSVGCFIWKNLNESISEDELVQLIVNEFEVEASTARTDLHSFLNELKKL
jgi:hypothetical protein